MEVTGNSAADYTAEGVARVKSTCLTLAQLLGDDLLKETVIVGGLVPTLLYESAAPVLEMGPHVGTNDVDLVLDLVILEAKRYEDMVTRLTRGGFAPDKKENKNIVRQRWRSEHGISVDFLMPPVPPDTAGGKFKNLTSDFAAVTIRGLDLALTHAISIELTGMDLAGRVVTRSIRVCGPHLFIVLKALAMANRDKHKDAYDLYFVLKNYEDGPEILGNRLAEFSAEASVADAIAFIERDFDRVEGRGPIDVCRFLGRVGEIDLAADVLAFGRAFVTGYRNDPKQDR